MTVSARAGSFISTRSLGTKALSSTRIEPISSVREEIGVSKGARTCRRPAHRAAGIPRVAPVQEVELPHADRNAFQELDRAALFAGVTNFCRRIDDPAPVDDCVDRAITAATSGRPWAGGRRRCLCPPTCGAGRRSR